MLFFKFCPVALYTIGQHWTECALWTDEQLGMRVIRNKLLMASFLLWK